MNFTAIQATYRLYKGGPCQKLIKVMKLTTFLLLIALVQASASSFAQKITLNETDAPLETVLSAIKNQSGYVFLYTDQDLKQIKITVAIKDATIQQTLQACFTNAGIEYKIVGSNILLKPAERASLLDDLKNKITASFAQVTVTGQVVDGTGEPMVGVTVKERGTQNGTHTDPKGKFSLTVTDDRTTIVFSYIGYETLEVGVKYIPAGSVITLNPAPENLQEVVINKGPYDEKRALSTGDVSVVSAKTIEEQPVTDPMQALEGQVAGLNIIQQSGFPGSNEAITIRGVNSIANGSTPLFIVDGVPFSSTSLTNTVR